MLRCQSGRRGPCPLALIKCVIAVERYPQCHGGNLHGWLAKVGATLFKSGSGQISHYLYQCGKGDSHAGSVSGFMPILQVFSSRVLHILSPIHL